MCDFKLFDQIVLIKQLFNNLFDATRLNYKVQKCVSILEEFLTRGNLFEVMCQQCKMGKEAGTLHLVKCWQL